MGAFVGTREVSKEFPTKAGVPYVIVPSKFEPKKEGQFFLSIFSVDLDFTAKELTSNGSSSSSSFSSSQTTSTSSYAPGSSSSSSSRSSGNPNALSLHGKWVIGKNSGGCPSNNSWKSSPQYIIEVKKSCKVEISLKQDKSPADGKFIHIGFFVFKSEPTKKKKINIRDLVFQSDQINLEEVIAKADLEAGTYNIVASTYYPDKENSYTISVSGACFTNPKEFYELTSDLDWKYVGISGKWRSGKDGGCGNHRNTFKENPHFLITCDQTQNIKIVLETEKDVAIGFYLFTTKDGKEPDESLPNGPFLSGLSSGKVTSFKDYPDFNPGKYILRATTFDPKIHENFTVQILCEKSPCKIVEI